MKKAISFMLALVMCLSLCACGGGEDAGKQGSGGLSIFPEETQDPIIAEITEQLVGEWRYVKNDKEYTILEFNNEGYYFMYPVTIYPSGHKVGTTLKGSYEVSAEIISCSIKYDNGDVTPGAFEYKVTYENGTLGITHKGLNLECVKGEWFDYLEENR